MRAVLSLEFLIVLAALLGVLALSATYYDRILDVYSENIAEKKADHAMNVFRTTLATCTQSTVTISFPYDVRVDCENGRLEVGKIVRNIPKCTGGGTGRTFTVSNCHISVQT